MNGREELRVALQAELDAKLGAGTYRLLPYSRTVDKPQHVTVMLRLDRLTPNSVQGQALRDAVYTVLIVGAKSDPKGGADEELEEALDAVLSVLDRSEWVLWEEATRGTYEDSKLPAYAVRITAQTARTE